MKLAAKKLELDPGIHEILKKPKRELMSLVTIKKNNTDKISAKILAEGTTGPPTPEADQVLYEKGTCLIPDILANSEGVTVSYFEWVQNLTREHWVLKEVNQKLENKITKRSMTCMSYRGKKKAK